mmetsp:Transcript_118880/g.236878  ORF Transcript_118880/g.236878 Transcript_118880/m.236878 type:complete len:244 (-) Transcript_118880:6-737(-)
MTDVLSNAMEHVPVSATRPSFQMPLEWSVATALSLAELAAVASSSAVVAVVEGYSTPSVVDVGGSSVRLRFPVPKEEDESMLSASASIVIGLRHRAMNATWIPAVAGVPGHHPDRAGLSRVGLLETVVMARPTVKGGVTFLDEDVLRAWIPQGQELELVPLRRLDDFHIDDGSGPWLRDRICITASQAEDFVAEHARAKQKTGCDIGQLLLGSGLRPEAAVQPPPQDEWSLARSGQLHRDCML